MATLRERHPARDGMGHADRPWLYNALSLDAQSRGVRLSPAGQRHSHSHTDINSHCDGNFYTNTEADTHTEIRADTETSSNACPTSVALVTRSMIW